jgi:hypothetical protein
VRLLLLLLASCGTTIYADHYASDCDADNQCTRISVGDQCACTCEFAAISDRDYDKYISDLERIGGCRTTCDPDASASCGLGIAARCSGAGTCVTYEIPDAGSE